MLDYLEENIPNIIGFTIATGASILIGVIIEKVKNKYRSLIYEVDVQTIVPPGPLSNSISLTVGNNWVNNLKTINIVILNNNNYDFENVSLYFNIPRDCTLHGSEGFINNREFALGYTSMHQKTYEETLKEYDEHPGEQGNKDIPDTLTQKLKFITSHLEYFVPILNRGDKLTFNFLVQDYDNILTESNVIISILHKSLGLKAETAPEIRFKQDIWKMVGIGVVIVTLMGLILSYNNYDTGEHIFVLLLIGASYSIVGAIILTTIRKIINYFK